MNLDRVEKIAEAVLYEGYLLYPYRASAVKNQQRWNFGVLCPRAYSEAQNNSEAWSMQTECLLEGDSSTRVTAKIRFLQIIDRSVGKLWQPIEEFSQLACPEFEFVAKLNTGGRTYTSWQEAVEREITIPLLRPATFSAQQPVLFEFPADREIEAIRDDNGKIAGVIVREWNAISVSVDIDTTEYKTGVSKVSVKISNTTPSESLETKTRSEVLVKSLVSTHTILVAENGEFVSLLDPPDSLRELTCACNNIGTWPVLVGDEGDRNTMLSSPIILYDYPQIAPESPGNLFDGTEIDEILSLRILTMTDEEKQEMRQSDERTRQILERTETMPPEQFMKLHGVLRGLQPTTPSADREAR
jgi:hypothetical protein